MRSDAPMFALLMALQVALAVVRCNRPLRRTLLGVLGAGKEIVTGHC